MTKIICSSCKKDISNSEGSVMFKCPSCGKQEIVRCKNCRQISAKFKCPECNFMGPN